MRQLTWSSSCAKHTGNSSRHGGHVSGSPCPAHRALCTPTGIHNISAPGETLLYIVVCHRDTHHHRDTVSLLQPGILLCQNHQHLPLGCPHSDILFVSECAELDTTQDLNNASTSPLPVGLKPKANQQNKENHYILPIIFFAALQDS